MNLAPSSTDDQGSPSLKVLVVDDHPPNRMLLEAILESGGHQVIVCESGAAALAHPELEKCDIGLLDLRMPGMDGFELLARIRAIPACSTMPLVFVTAFEDREIHERALASGVDDFLVKPARKTEVLIRVRSLVALRRAKAALTVSAAQLAEKNAELERANEARRILANFVVHDLKNPLQSIALGTHLLGSAPELTADGRDIVHTMAECATRMKRLVADLLDVEKDDAGLFTTTTSRIPIAVLSEMLWAIAKENHSGIRVEVIRNPMDGAVLANEDLFFRVLSNTVENAVRHSPTGSVVRLVADRSETELRIRVIDQGAGIPPEHRARIFDRFVQIESPIPGTKLGHGLGLAFCRAAMRAMNGSIEALEGEGGIGSTFEVRLPISVEE